MSQQLSDHLQIHVNGRQTFFLSKEILSAYSEKLRIIIKKENKNSVIEINDFPGSSYGFELVLRFCYNNGRLSINVSNVAILHCCGVFLGMTEKISTHNLIKQTEEFLQGLVCWSWNDIVLSLKSCEVFFAYADSLGLIEKLISALISKITQNSEVNSIAYYSPSSSSSSPESSKPFSTNKQWWFDDLTILPPLMIEKLIRNLGSENNTIVLTRFIFHYLKTRGQSLPKDSLTARKQYSTIADLAANVVISEGKTVFSCRKLFWVLKFLSGFKLSKQCKNGLEILIGGMLEQTTLDDLLVSGHCGSVYDVDMVIRLIKVFVVNGERESSTQKLKKVGVLIDKYLREIAPDQSLNVLKFLEVAESLPDSARDCFDGVYRAVDIYLQSHSTLSLEERWRLCRCLNYEKLSLESCKDIAMNPKVPPNVSIQALKSQTSKLQDQKFVHENISQRKTDIIMVLNEYNDDESITKSHGVIDEGVEMNLKKMQWRVIELEKVCREMKVQMSRIVKQNFVATPTQNRALPRLC